MKLYQYLLDRRSFLCGMNVIASSLSASMCEIFFGTKEVD